MKAYWKGGICYLMGLEMPEDKIWAILKALKIQKIKGLS